MAAKISPDDNPVFRLLYNCAMGALNLHILANGTENADILRERAKGEYAGWTETVDKENSHRGLAADWKGLNQLDTTDCRVLCTWKYLVQVMSIIADARPEMGWSTAWHQI